MNPKTTKIVSYSLFVVALMLSYYLYSAIMEPIREKERIDKIEQKVIAKLELIREAQKAYMKTNGKYAATWDSLIHFVDNGLIYNVSPIEKIYPWQEYRPQRPWLGDSIAIIMDTLESVPAKQFISQEVSKLKRKTKFTEFETEKLPYKPGTDEKFELYTGKIEMGGIMVGVIEVKDPNPVDPNRKEKNDIINQRPLRFGARHEVSTSGNWE